jgi:phosphoribosyl-dephospho-CoA transferase
VVRRDDSAGADGLCLGVALPPTHTVRKLPLQVDAQVVRHTTPPLALVAVIPSAPSSWRHELARLAAGASTIGVELRVYGSLVWQHMSGEPYVTPTSDVDLLWRAADQARLEEMLEYLVRWESTSGLVADGELLLGDDTAVAWKELLRRPRQLLIKRSSGVELRTYGEALSLIAPSPC